MPGRDSAAGDLWEKAAELERQFEGYKRRLTERSAAVVVPSPGRPDVVDDDGNGARDQEEAPVEVVVGRGSRYEEYARRRDEKLRQEWRARMERKEAEMKDLWARLDRGRRTDVIGGLTATPAKEQKPLNIAKPIAPVTPRCSSSAMKLPRIRSSTSSSPAAASPRLSNRRPSHREPPQAELPNTPRKESRVPAPSTTAGSAAAASTTPRLKTMSRSRSTLKDNKERASSSIRESPRPPRFQPPRASYDSAGDLKEAVPAPSAADAIAVRQNRFHEQVVLAEIKMAAAIASGPLQLRRSGNGVRGTSPPSAIPRQIDVCARVESIGCKYVESSSEGSDVEAKNIYMDEGNGENEIAQFSNKLGNAEITGDSETYVYIKKDNDNEAVKSSNSSVGSGPDAEPKSEEHEKGPETFEEAMDSSDTSVKQRPAIDEEAASGESFESSYSNVQSSFSHRSETAASATDSPLYTPPSSRALSTEQLLEADAALIRKKWEEEGDDDSEDAIVILPSAARSDVPVAAQSPLDAVAGLKRFLNFGKKKSTETAVVVVERVPPSLVTLAGDDGVSDGWLPGNCIKQRLGSCGAASDDLESSYVISPHPHVRSLQSFAPLCPPKSELKDVVRPAKSTPVHRSFFSFSSFKNRAN